MNDGPNPKTPIVPLNLAKAEVHWRRYDGGSVDDRHRNKLLSFTKEKVGILIRKGFTSGTCLCRVDNGEVCYVWELIEKSGFDYPETFDEWMENRK
jgi:hypothetical protein